MPIVSQAILEAADVHDSVLHARLYLRFGSFLLHQGQHRMAAQAVEIAAGHLPEIGADSYHLEQVLLLLRTQAQRSHQELEKSPNLIETACSLAEKVDDPELTAELYLDECHILLQEGDSIAAPKAYGLAKKAYALWRHRGVVPHAHYSALLRIKAARIMSKFQRADRLIRWLKPKVNIDGTRIIYADLLYEEGSIALYLDDLVRAETCLSKAASIFEDLKMMHHWAASCMVLSLALIADQQYDAANQALETASNAWERLQYDAGHVRVKIYAAYSAIKRSHFAEAQSLLQDAHTLLEGVSNNKLKQALLAEIEDMESRIDNQPART